MSSAEPGMSLTDAGKQYSQASSTALRRLDSLDRKFEAINHRIDDVAAIGDEVTDSSDDNIARLIKAKNDLAQIAGDLERLQCRELDAVETTELTSGKAEAKLHRKSLNIAVENLLRRTQDLHSDYISTVDKLRAAGLRDNDANHSQNNVPTALLPTSDQGVENPNTVKGIVENSGGNKGSNRRDRRRNYFAKKFRRHHGRGGEKIGETTALNVGISTN